MKRIYGVDKDAELARALDISPQTLSSWRQRSAVPYALCVECAKSKGASLDWLLYGEGPMMREEKALEDEADTAQPQSCADLRAQITKILEDLPRKDLEDILSESIHRKRLRTLEQRFENLQAQFFDTSQEAV
ncbi:helix-turn-helix domain-containing protein [Marinobacter szutsaonensis]